MSTVRTGTDAWTYYEFGARSLHDEITALIIRDLDDGVDGDAVEPDLREQPTGRTFPIISVLAIDVALESEPIDPHRVGRMTQLLLPVQREQDLIAVTYLRQRPELLAKIRNRIAREIAEYCTSVFLGVRDRYGRVPTLAEFREAVEPGSPDR